MAIAGGGGGGAGSQHLPNFYTQLQCSPVDLHNYLSKILIELGYIQLVPIIINYALEDADYA